MGPYAKKLIAEIEKHVAAGREPDVLATIRGPGPIEVPTDVLPGVFVWMKSYQYLVKVASKIMGSRTLKKFTDMVRFTDEEYLPHGPPDSPITDSFFFGWWAIDREVGKGGETIATIVADIAEKYGGSLDDIERIRALSETHLRIWRVEERDGRSARLSDLVTGDEVEVGLAAPWDGEKGQLWLARAVPEMCFTPYAIDGDDAEAEWRAYFERVLGDASGAELRSRYCDHMRGTDDETRWLEYILDGYYEGNQHTLHLKGIPDKPETLPHSEENFSLLDQIDTDDPRDRVMHELLVTDLLMDALGDFISARESFELPEIEPDEETLLDPMLMAYACYGLELDNGRSFLESFLGSAELEEEDRASLQAIANGWFSLFEVAHVKLDQGMELVDVLQKKTIWVSEKAATRQIALGDLLAAWVEDDGDRITLEGTNLHFPRLTAETVKGFATDYYAGIPNDDTSWRFKLASLAPILAALHEKLQAEPPVPTILNEEGEEIVFSEARYRLVGDVADKLEAAGWEGEGGSFVLVEDEHIRASAEIDGDRLSLFATSPAQLDAAKRVLESVLGEAAIHQTDVFQDAQVAIAEGLRGPPREAKPLPPEMQAELRSFLEHELQSWLDTPIPMLGNRTPREAVRTERGRDDVKMMLLEQERILEGHQQLDEPIDFKPLWASLGLEYPSD